MLGEFDFLAETGASSCNGGLNVWHRTAQGLHQISRNSLNWFKSWGGLKHIHTQADGMLILQAHFFPNLKKWLQAKNTENIISNISLCATFKYTIHRVYIDSTAE